MRSAHTETTVFPEHRLGNRTKNLRALGYFFRCVLVLLCSYGCVRTVFDSVGAYLPRGLLIGSCLIFCTVFCLASLSVKTAVAGAAATVIGTVAVLSYKGGVVKIILAMGGAIVNAWRTRLDELGYRVMPVGGLVADILGEIDSTETEMYLWGAVFTSLLVCAVVTALSVRRVRLIPLIAAVLSVCMYFVLYGASSQNLGPALVIVSVTAMSALYYYENVFASKRAVRESIGVDERSVSAKREIIHTVHASSELGGFVGMAAAMLMAVLIAVPMGTADAMKDIPAVSGMIDRSADVVVSVTDGYFPDADGFLYIGRESLNSRSTELRHRETGGDIVLSVSADVDVPVYLRGWTGVDYIDDNWKSVSYSRMSEYRRVFGKGFSAELLTNELLRAVDPALTALPSGASYVSHEDFGYIIAPVHIRRLNETEMLLPSYTDPEVNLLLYGTNDPHYGGYASYYEGIFTSSGLSADAPYTVKAHLALPPTSETLMNISFLVRYYNEQREAVSAIRSLLSRGADEDEIQNEYLILMADKPVERQETTLSGHYIFPNGHDTLAWRYVYEMTSEERERVDALIDSMDNYNNYVYANYITVCENYEAFDALADKIVADSGTSVVYTYAGRHRMVEAVINYLSANMTYTLTPSEPSDERPYYNSADTFLFDTGEGYCVQYATSAVMLLRCLGIPARYATGYIADSFEASATNSPGAYTATVTEDQAHAWIEVYYDYYGWIQYEATAPFVTDVASFSPIGGDILFGEDGDALAPDTSVDEPVHADTAAPTPPVSDDVDVNDWNGGAAALITAVIAVTVTAVAVTVCLVIKRRGSRALDRLNAAVVSGRHGGLSPEQGRDTAVMLGDVIYRLLSFEGLTPGDAETPTRFFTRAEEKLGETTGVCFAAVCEAMHAYEFGGAVTDTQLMTLADCAEALYSHAVRANYPIKAAYVKYFLIAT